MTSAPQTDRARMLLELDRPDEARRMLAGLVAADPGDPDALCLLAQSCLATSDPAGALQAATAAIRIAPEEEWAYRLAALALARQSQTGPARWHADAAVRVDPQSWRTHLVRAQVDLAGKAVDRCTLAAAQEATRLAPDEAECHRAVGNALLALNRRREAETALRNAARLQPESAAIRNDLARLHVSQRRLGRAAAGFADAVALDPTDDIAAANLAVVAARMLRVVHLILWVTLLVPSAIAAGRHQHVAAVVGFAVAGASLVVLAAVLRHGAGPRLPRLLRATLRRDRLLGVWLGFLILSFALLGVAAFAPARAIDPATTLSFYCLAAGLVAGVVRNRRRRP